MNQNVQANQFFNLMSISREEWERYTDKVESIEEKLDDLFFDEGLEGRTGFDDMRLLRLVINRFSSFKFFIGLIVGVLTIGVPALIGMTKLFQIIKAYFNGG